MQTKPHAEVRDVLYLGRDGAGREVFCERWFFGIGATPKPQPGRPETWTRPDVFRLPPEAARYHYGQRYQERGR
jgi:hypothetical protein